MEEADLTLFFDWSERIFKAIENSHPINLIELKGACFELEAIVPTEGDPLSIQAQSAHICLLSSLELLLGIETNGAIDSSNSIVDAFDNYVWLIQKRIKGDATPPTDYHLLQREMERQLLDAAFVKGYPNIAHDRLMEYRFENLQYSVPVAI